MKNYSSILSPKKDKKRYQSLVLLIEMHVFYLQPEKLFASVTLPCCAVDRNGEGGSRIPQCPA
jgi:hypothetical protein